MGGRELLEIYITLTNHLIRAKGFIRIHIFTVLPKASENIDDPKLFTPPPELEAV